MNRITHLFDNKNKDILNVYVTAGFPNLNDTARILQELQVNKVDLIELGIPYSDPLADGTTIQESSAQALKNGVDLKYIFTTVKQSRENGLTTPIILMGYYNQMLQFGEERFLKACKSAGVDGLIIPDLPMDIYTRDYKSLFESYQIGISFLITPDTSDDRIRQADQLSDGFIYMVSQSSITGKTGGISLAQEAYFKRIKSLSLTTAKLIGFGIHNQSTYNIACANAEGAIIGSAFIRHLNQYGAKAQSVQQFISTIR